MARHKDNTRHYPTGSYKSLQGILPLCFMAGPSFFDGWRLSDTNSTRSTVCPPFIDPENQTTEASSRRRLSPAEQLRIYDFKQPH
jgi:hypothetical protein